MKVSIELFIDNKWELNIRIYEIKKDLKSDDLIDIPNKRRNCKLI